MKKHLLSFLFSAASLAGFSQAVQLNNNKSLEVRAHLGNKMIFAEAKDSLLWVTDATQGGTVSLGDRVKMNSDAGYIVHNDKLYFAGRALKNTLGLEIWVTDGTLAGTIMLQDVNPGDNSSLPDNFTVLNNKVYFSAYTDNEGRELWMTDGTKAGTVMVKDINPGMAGSNDAAGYDLWTIDNAIYFAADDGAHGKELWKSDGTAAGTNMLKDIEDGAPGSLPAQFFKYKNMIVFSAGADCELWRTDGTTAGTYRIKNINPNYNSFPGNFMVFKDKLFFACDAHTFNNSNIELWSTDGTEANTIMVKDINLMGGSYPMLSSSIHYPDKFIFSAFSFTYGYELWESDGTPAGTKLFVDLFPNSNGGGTFPLMPVDFVTGASHTNLFQGDKFFIMHTRDNEGAELWISNGTVAGTRLVRDINPGAKDGFVPGSYFQTANRLYFIGDNGVNGKELWKTDGSFAGTMMVADINAGAGSSNPFIAGVLNGKLIVQAADDGSTVNTDLYRIEDNLVLPVKLISFNAQKQATGIQLKWEAITSNVYGFDVERSFDASSYETIADVAAEKENTRVQYAHLDKDNAITSKATVYYRLKIKEKDGSHSYSPVIVIRQQATANKARLLKNPVQDQIAVFIDNHEASRYELTSNSGAKYKAGVFNGTGYHTIDVKGMAAGIYYLTIYDNNNAQTLRVLKQ